MRLNGSIQLFPDKGIACNQGNICIRLIARWGIAFLLSLAGSSALFAQTAENSAASDVELVADFVWSEESAGGSRIMYSRYSTGGWSQPETVVENAGLNILPAIAAAKPGDMVAVWSKVSAKGITLHYSRFIKDESSGDGKWGKEKLLSAERTVNLAPVLLADNGGYHVFWSAHEGSDDDILSSRLLPGGWIEPNQVHENNTEVDALPEAGFDEDRRIWLRWESIGTKSAEPRVQIYESDGSIGKQDRKEPLDLDRLAKQSREIFDLAPPVFFHSKSRATMYFHGDTTHPVRLFPGNLLP